MDLTGSPSDGAGRAVDTRIGQLCATCVRDTSVDGGGVSVLSSDGVPVLLHATDPVSRAIEDLQFTLGEGPCVEASLAGTPILVSDLNDPAEGVSGRWPVFMSEARKVGVRAVFAFPIRTGAIALGTVDLYRNKPGPLTNDQLASGLRTVDAIGARLLGAESLGPVAETTYPMTVHQAAGMVMTQTGSSIEEALVRMRAHAYAEGVSVADLATDVVQGRRRFFKEDL